MPDVHTPEQRSFNMSRIRSKNTKPEMVVRKFLFSQGFRYRLHEKKLPGRPDIVLPKYKTVVFIHGCFWHGHEDCRYFVVPKTRTDWWLAKIRHNRENDKINMQKLEEIGWRVLEVFECGLKSGKQQDTLNMIVSLLKDSIY